MFYHVMHRHLNYYICSCSAVTPKDFGLLIKIKMNLLKSLLATMGKFYIEVIHSISSAYLKSIVFKIICRGD